MTDFLREIRKKVQNEIEMVDSEYIFTLPVLDGLEGEKYTKQKVTTLHCATTAGLGNDNITTITEPEAAMYYFINSIKDNVSKWIKCRLVNEDRICVFDFDGGTLDICFGTYKLNNGKPTVVDIISIGEYYDEKGNTLSLGGDRFDNKMAIAVCEKYGIELIIKSQDSNGVVDAEFGGEKMVGGSSLIDIIKERLEEEFSFSGTGIFNAYDYSIYDRVNDYEKVRQDATYPIVRGAAIAYMTTITDLFPIEIKISSVKNPKCCIIYSKGESFHEERKNFNSASIWGEWIITGSVDGDKHYKLGSFVIEKTSNAPPLATIITRVTKDRVIKVYYQLGKSNGEKEIKEINIYL